MSTSSAGEALGPEAARSARRLGPRVARAAVQVRGDAVLVVTDTLIALVTYSLLFALRSDFGVTGTDVDGIEWFLPAACVIQVVATWAWGGYGRTWRHASIDEARRLLCAGATTAVVLLVIFGWATMHVPLAILVAGPVLVTFLYGMVRFQSRLFAFRRFGDRTTGVRVAVVGAGSAGSAALRELQSNGRLGLVPVVALDDDPALRGRQIHGVPIAGGIDDLEPVVRDRDVQQVLYAIPSAPSSVLRRVAAAAESAGVPVRVLPAPSAWVHGTPRLRDLRDLRDLSIEDLLGRRAVAVDLTPVRALLGGRRVLVTGGGGWIGAEIGRQVAEQGPAALVLLDHDETHLHDAVHGLGAAVQTALCDVRDATALTALFERLRPEVVFHAAAHKHVPILETHACEAIATNILGTANVVEAAAHVGTPHLVCISTDKAATPTGVMGASKWMAEQIVAVRAPAGAAWCSVRFGNVLGSRGSVIPTFERQIAAGGPVTVTHPAMTRYFMSTDEAVQLVVLAAAITRDRRVLALDMGEQVNIHQLAERMIRLCGYQPGVDIEIEITGILPGENLSEQVVGPAEHGEPANGGHIVAITPVAVDGAELDDWVTRLETISLDGDHDAARIALLAVAAAALQITGDADGVVARPPSLQARS